MLRYCRRRRKVFQVNAVLRDGRREEGESEARTRAARSPTEQWGGDRRRGEKSRGREGDMEGERQGETGGRKTAKRESARARARERGHARRHDGEMAAQTYEKRKRS